MGSLPTTSGTTLHGTRHRAPPEPAVTSARGPASCHTPPVRPSPFAIGPVVTAALLAVLLTGCAPSAANHPDSSPSALPTSPVAPVRYEIPADLCDRLDHAPLSGLLDFANATVKPRPDNPDEPREGTRRCMIGAFPATRDRVLQLIVTAAVVDPDSDASEPPGAATSDDGTLLKIRRRVDGLGDEAWLDYTAHRRALDSPFGNTPLRSTTAFLLVTEGAAEIILRLQLSHPENEGREAVEGCLTAYARQVLELIRAD